MSLVLCLLLVAHLHAQQDTPQEVQAAPAQAQPAASSGRPGPSGGQPMPNTGQPMPGGQPQPGADGQKPGEEKKPEDTTAPIKRSEKPEVDPDPQELEVRPDKQGRVSFNFRAQPWPAVLDWLAEISNTSLDWQELPGDYLNLTTQRAYTVDEVRDLINERLMTRGYTLLQQQEGLLVVKLETLNPARVPRVHPEDLRYRDAHEFVKVSFPLSWLLAEEAVEELKPMLSPHGKMAALSTSNRLEILDVVSNLREIYHVLQEEQSADVRSAKVHEFYLRHTRAEDVLVQLKGLLGMNEGGGGGAGANLNPQMMQQMQQMQQQMMQQMQRAQQQPGGGAKGRNKSASPDEVHLVINARQNSIIANAPPDKLVLIAEAVKMFDVPPQPGATIGANFQRVRVFRLAQLDPKSLVSMLEQAGNLDPTTQLVADDKNQALIAYATPADQITIDALINKLDGTGRQFKVLRLRRLQADYVAGTIQFMMGEEEKEDNNSRRGYYSFYGYGQQQQDNKSKDKFRVDADVINNRLLLWANDIELEAVENLLIQLGEIRDPGQISDRGRHRTVDIGTQEDAQQLLERLKEVWPQVSSSPLQIKIPPPKPKPVPETPPQPQSSSGESDTKPSPPKAEEGSDKAVMGRHPHQAPVHWAALVQAEGTSDAQGEAPPDQPQQPAPAELEGLSQEQLLQRYFPQQSPQDAAASSASGSTDQPIVVQLDENGRLTIASENPAVLDLLEDILMDIKPPPKDWAVFQLQHAEAYFVAWNLEDFFEEQEEDDSSDNYPWFWGPREESSKDEGLRLSQRKPLKFLSDSDTNTIVVQHANEEQLATIRELIELYDKPQPITEEKKRMNATYAVRYSKASFIAESIKDVFRDLLSSNDRALQEPQQSNERGRDGDRPSTPPPIRSSSAFGGKLSLGFDDLSNTLLISTEGEQLMKLVMDMVKRVDEAAQPVSTVRVVNLKTGIGGDKVRVLLQGILEDQKQQQQQEMQQQQQPNGNPPGPPNGRRGPRNFQPNANSFQSIESDG